MPSPSLAAAAATVMVGLCLLAPSPSWAQTTFVARADRTSTSIGEAIAYEVTLSLTEGRVQSYKAPEFRGFRVDGEYPSQSTQIQMGGGASVMRSVYSWRYELAPTESGRLTIPPARVKVGGKELKTGSVTVTVASGALSPPGRSADAAPGRPARPPARRQRRFRSPFDDIFADDPLAPPTQAPIQIPGPSASAPDPAAEGSFIRAVPDKSKVHVGEQVVVQWYLYLTDRQDKYQAVVEPRTDGFWSEELVMPNAQGGGLALSQQVHNGRLYLVAPLMRKALFPLQTGKLTITPMEADISQVDFFGRQVRTQRLKADPVTLEVVPLPSAGQPRNFDPSAVGRFTLEARLDRSTVAVGEAVTIKLVITGAGNLRKLTPPPLPPELSGDAWRSYDAKVDVQVENNDGITGVKTVEYLLLAQRPGITELKPFALAYFDPAENKYQVARSAPLRIEVAGGDPRTAGAGGTRQGAAAPGTVGVENVLPSEIRPLRSRATLSRDLGTTFYQSSSFLLVVLLPPLAFAGTVLFDRVRARMQRDTERGRRRKGRRLVRQHLRAAEEELDKGDAGAFFVEIDRVLRGVLNARLGHSVAGLSREELARELAASGVPAELGNRVVAELEACDRARFAPGAVGQPEMRASLDRAAELILVLEKAPTRNTGAGAVG